MDADVDTINGLTEKVIGRAFRVSTTLGCGFLEKGYENALFHELRKAGLSVAQQSAITIRYDGIVHQSVSTRG